MNRLASGVIDGPDDLIGIGECLNLLDDLEGQMGPEGPLAQKIEKARLIFRRLILEESADRGADWREVQRLLGSLGSAGEVQNGEDQPALMGSDRAGRNRNRAATR